MTELFGFSRSSVARIWRAVLAVERYLLARSTKDTAGQPARRLPRTYRRFTLTEQLDAGGSADVAWPDGSTGTVTDANTAAWGLEGETGEAAAYPDGSGGVEWRITTNPGQAIYEATLDNDVTAAGDVDVSIGIGGNTRTLSAYMPAAPGSGKKWASGSPVFVGHFRGEWKIVSIVGCPVDA